MPIYCMGCKEYFTDFVEFQTHDCPSPNDLGEMFVNRRPEVAYR